MAILLTPPTRPGGSEGDIQVNLSSRFGAVPGLNWDDGKLGIPGDIELDDGGTFQTTLQMVTPTANRTISFPDATGTVALVGGSSGQFLYNLNGAVAGVSTVTTDGTNVTLTGRFISSVNGAVSAPPLSLTGTWFTGGTATTTKPALLIEPTGTTSTAWSTSGTGFGVNAPSGFGGNLVDFQVNGVSRFRVASNGNIFGNVVSTSTAGLQAPTGFGTITYASTVDLDLAVQHGRVDTITLTGPLTLTTSNLANGLVTGLRLLPGASARDLTFPADWKFVSAKPASLPADKVARLTIEVHGTTNADVVAAIAIQP